eukprot:SAG31_NODE_41010_length_278_cov_0.581006_1_plen_71_part_10
MLPLQKSEAKTDKQNLLVVAQNVQWQSICKPVLRATFRTILHENSGSKSKPRQRRPFHRSGRGERLLWLVA